MVELFANSEDPDQMPHSVASDLGLHCLSVTSLGVSSVQWVNHYHTACQTPSKKVFFKGKECAPNVF